MTRGPRGADGPADQASVEPWSDDAVWSFIEASDDLIVVVDARQRIVAANASLYQRLRRDAGSIVGEHVLSLHPEAHRGEAEEVVREMLAGRQSICVLPLAVSDGSELHVDTRIIPGRWRGEPALFGVSRDLTKRVADEARTRAQRDELEGRVEERTRALTRANEELADENERRQRVELALREERDRLRALALELNRVREQERRRLAATLHDSVSQLLAVLRLRLAPLKKQELDASGAESLQGALDLLADASAQVRAVTLELSPPLLYERGIAPALEWLAAHFEERHGLRTSLSIDLAGRSLSDEARGLLWRSAREFLMNIIKHAACLSAHLALALEHVEAGDRDAWVSLSVRCPCGARHREAADRAAASGGFGLFSLREQARGVGGEVSFALTEDGGSLARVRLPLDGWSASPPSKQTSTT